MEPGRSRLVRLTPAEVGSLVAGIPGLSFWWARPAKVAQPLLESGQPKAVRAVQVGLTRNVDAFHSSLARAAVTAFGDDPDADVDQAGSETAVNFALELADVLSTELAVLVVEVVAEAGTGLSPQVLAHRDELVRLVRDGSDSDLDPESAGISTESSASTDVESHLEVARRLLAQVAPIVEGLRDVGASIERGQVPNEGPRTSLQEAERWISDVHEILFDKPSLEVLVESLEAKLESRAAEYADLQELRAAVEALRRAGLGKSADELLQHHAFTSDDALSSAIASLDMGLGVRADVEIVDAAESKEVASSSGASTPVADFRGAAEANVGVELPPDEVAEAANPQLEAEPEADPTTESDIELTLEPEEAEVREGSQHELDDELRVEAGPDIKPNANPEPNGGALIPEQGREVLDPWADGIIAALIRAGRERIALLAAEAYEAIPEQVRMLRLFVGAFDVRADVLLAQDPELIRDDSTDTEYNADDNRLLFASYARVALELGFSPVGSLERFRQAAAIEGLPIAETAEAIVRLTTRGFKRPIGAVTLTALPDDWRRFADSATGRLDGLRSLRASYQRATRIVHYLVRNNQPVGAALEACIELAKSSADGHATRSEDWKALEVVAVRLRDWTERERLILEADRVLSTSQQLRKPIIASARDRLFSAMGEAAEVLEEALALRARAEGSGAGDDPQDMADLVASAQSAVGWETHTVGDTALRRLVEWVCAAEIAIRPPASLEQLVLEELLPLYEIPRDADGKPIRGPGSSDEIQALIKVRPMYPDVFNGYLEVGNIAVAEQVLQRSSNHPPAAEDDLSRATQTLARRNQELVGEVDRVLDRLRSLNDDDHVRELSRELDNLRTPESNRFDLSLPPLTAIRERGEAYLSDVREGLRDRARALGETPDARRILELLESRDEQLAVDYLTLAEVGEPLPDVAPPSGDDFGAFFPSVVRAAEEAKRDRALDNINEVRKQLGATAAPSNRMLSDGLRAWTELVNDGGVVALTESRLGQVLRMLGLIPAEQHWSKELTRTRRAGYATYETRATPLDRSYVPSLGTQAHLFNVTVVWDSTSPQQLLNYIENNHRNRANVILYLGTLTVDQRLDLRRQTTRPAVDFSPVVVDMPVIAWLSVQPEPGWRLTQRVVLPFTTLNPYTPFAGGEVPEEVFVGREAERREIMDPTGSMFVYGGRQLGKSALLRRVERGVMQGRAGGPDAGGDVAVYLDVKSEGIGESAAPSALWGALVPRLAKVGVLASAHLEATAEAVSQAILSWLEADGSRRLLLLLDEADNFLTTDAKDGFPVLARLKGTMEQSSRRFKPVFAGLHQVQRFHDLPNTPVVHGGRDILIGPLRPIDARELVRDPLFALGYDFETQDTMWRLLRLTNYQASLIQIICEALVRHLRTSTLPREGGRIVITTRDVDDVYAKHEVRDLIAQRFRWTINLDSRYRIIALVTALRSLESRPGERFPSPDLHDDCAVYWEKGFARSVLSRAEFSRYLDEMKGLGVLHQQDDDFGLRSPSILGLLGSRESIEAELMDAEQLEVDAPYNPAVNRRVLSVAADETETRSPLPDAAIGELLDHGSESRVKIVAGTPALGIDRVAQALMRGAGDRDGLRLVSVPFATLGDQLGGHESAHLIVDLTAADAPGRRAALTALREADVFASVIMLAKDVPPDATNLVLLQRWSVEGLRSWHEPPFRRQELRFETGGWPRLVERAVYLVMHGASTEAAFETIRNETTMPKLARDFLESTEVPLDIVDTWMEWFSTSGSNPEVQLTPASLEDLEAAFDSEARPIVDRLQLFDALDEAPGGWSLDRTLARAFRAARE